jgi:glycosyltransferase involved in cell wall biosynthesis
MATTTLVVRGATGPRVVVVGPLPPPHHGGSVATSFVLRSRLARECTLLHLDTTDRRGLDNIGRFDAGNVLLAAKHAASLLRMLAVHRPRAVYVPLAQNYAGVLRDALFVLPALATRRQVVLHLHGGGLRSFYDSADPVMRALLRVMLGGATRVIVLGEALRPMLAGLAAPHRVAVLPNGTEDPFGGMPERAGGKGPVRVLYLGNLMRAKGFLEVIDALVTLRGEGHEVVLDMAGGFASEQDRRDALARARPSAGHVTFHGVVAGARKHELLRAADIFCFPSHSEGHPYVVLEAMSAGLPIVTTRLPALAETVVDGESGLLVTPGDVAGIADALRRLIERPGLRLQLGRASRARFEEQYCYEAWSDGLARIMAEVAA